GSSKMKPKSGKAEGNVPNRPKYNKKEQKSATKRKFGNVQKRWKEEDKEIKDISTKYKSLKRGSCEKFADFPLSSKTQQGLELSKFVIPTEIQRETIGLGIKGHDILGAAKTGSGKTLAFVIPVLECLWRQKWSSNDGLGALIISPTRELAYQTFEVLRKVG
ncbi:unnamed protein product, partial [Owenia fusiformis]